MIYSFGFGKLVTIYTEADNVLYGLYAAGQDEAEARENALKALRACQYLTPEMEKLAEDNLVLMEYTKPVMAIMRF